MDVCRCIVPLRHEGTLNSRRATSPLVKVGGLCPPTGCSPSKLGRILKPNRTVTCLMLKVTANDRRVHLVLCHDELRGPRSDTVGQMWHK
ncbi:hypothetical protein TNCV_2601231 [Trichonephila clavipes]|nr:hypothetical protein TNCV_2601231 [Trichonephila clavipes]